MGSHVALNRQFSPVSFSQIKTEMDDDYYWDIEGTKEKHWDDLDHRYRCVILAEAGAGKTEELRQHALDLSEQAKPAFFIRIEDITAGFDQAFEVGDEAQFQAWLKSTDEAWFFLDSVDEARLDNPRTFEKALRVFAKTIKHGAHRAHIYLTSRPYAWRPNEDKRLLDDLLFYPAETSSEHKTALTVYTMCPLNEERIRRFCEAREAANIDSLLKEIERANLWGLSERPFDLEGILLKWAEDSELGSRLVMLRHNIDIQLRDEHNTDRAHRQPLNLEQAREGARCLAAAVFLTGKVGLNVPDNASSKPGIEGEDILADWVPEDVRALLERGVFNDIIYGAVRFRHRDVRELLAAEWFDTLLKRGSNRRAIENLMFREQYGEQIITPSLRPILPWLILLDDGICRKTLDSHPEIAIESGDPSQLPLLVRKNILSNIVLRIVSNIDDRSARENSSIARIAHADLSGDVLELIKKHNDNDDALFFLGRLVWQGNMSTCVDPLMSVTADSSRGIYTRIVSARAIMACGSAEQKGGLWQTLNQGDTQIPRKLLAELVNEATLDEDTVKQLVISLAKLQPYERYSSTGLSRALHQFIERCPIGQHLQAEINLLINGLNGYLEKEPYIERKECHVSKEFAWLLGPATQLIEKLVVARNEIALGTTVLSILLKVPALRFWSGSDFKEYKGHLQTLIPDWPELNDALYWASFDQARAIEAEKSGEVNVNQYAAFWLGHYWAFDANSLSRLLHYMCTRSAPEDQLIALISAFHVYVRADKPADILSSLHNSVKQNAALKAQLDSLLHPTVSDAAREQEEKHREYDRKHAEEEAKQKQNRDKWISKLRGAPERVYKSGLQTKFTFNNDHYYLMLELDDYSSLVDRSAYSDWQGLAEEFGEDVAQAYREAAVNHWRNYTPAISSETGKKECQTTYELLFAMAGLEIEAAEQLAFPKNLTDDEVHHILHYITWELNGFPKWFERLSVAFPKFTLEAVLKELDWELEHTEPDKPLHYIISDVVNHAPWLHAVIAPVLLDWIGAKPEYLKNNRHHCLHILVNGETAPNILSVLASNQIKLTNDLDSMAVWYALRVDCDPPKGIPEIEAWLFSLDSKAATQAAQVFITALMGGKYWNENTPNVGHYQAPEYLTKLYVLMNLYIRTGEDINRVGGGVYSPGLRDDAQDARDRIFKLLAETPGKAGYIFIKQLASKQANPNYRQWMLKEAHKRAEQDGNLEHWNAKQVKEFSDSQTITPVTHRQLYDLAVQRLQDLKSWLELGNDSPWETWQRAAKETQMRTLIAGWLNQASNCQYTIAQEPELANSQRMDITLSSTRVQSPVPIELKLLDKNWSGNDLCERLRNQLVGDYLREESAGCGVMLLVWQGNKKEKRWIINGHRVALNELACALKNYWLSIAENYPDIEDIDVIVINLATRAAVSNT